MQMLASKLGIRLVLLLGKSAPRPAPVAVMTALTSVEVTNNIDGEDGFQLVFTLTKGKRGEFDLVASGAVDPETRAVVGVLIGATLNPLVDGVIYHQQLQPGENGSATLTVMGRSIEVLLDLEEKDQAYPSLSASAIVRQILSNYQAQGIIAGDGITSTSETPSDKERIPRQQGTDLAYIRGLAEQNSFIFYLEPKTLGTTAAYWGRADQTGNSLATLNVNLGTSSNVTEMHFRQNPLVVVQVAADTFDAASMRVQSLPPPVNNSVAPVDRPIAARRIVRLRNAARLGTAGAQDAAAARMTSAPDPVTVEGTLETLRYGDVLRAHRMVSVCGGGRSYDGDYLVRSVTHGIEAGKYTQRFTLSGKGLGR